LPAQRHFALAALDLFLLLMEKPPSSQMPRASYRASSA
jgi:hypothetical protein